MKKLTTKQIALLALGGSLLVCLAVVVWSNITWGQYVADNDSRYEVATTDIKDRLASAKSSDDIEAIGEQARQVADEQCYASLLTGWRIQVIAQSGQYQQQCQEQRTSLRLVAAQAEQLQSRLTTEDLVAAIIKKADDGLEKVKAGDYRAQQKLWQQARDDLSKIAPHDSYTDDLKAQQAAIKTIIERYNDLINADKAQQRTDFDDAAVELRAAYDKLATTSSQTATSYRQLTTSLHEAIEAL